MKFFLVLYGVLLTVFTATAQELDWSSNADFNTEKLLEISGQAQMLTIDAPVLIEGTVQVPENLTLRFTKNGVFRIANEQSFLIINGPIVAGRQQIFDVSANGVTSYRFESASNIQLLSNQRYFPEWWGVFPNVIPGKNGNTLPKASHHQFMKEMMLDIAASNGGELVFDEGVYYIRDLIIDFDNIEIRGQGTSNTTLRFDAENYGFSTRRGTIIMIQGPTLEKFYSKLVPEGIPIAGNFNFTEEQRTIENIIVRDFSLEWEEGAAKADPSMNGIAVMNARNVLIDNVHVDLFGANRAFFLGNAFDGDVTENITVANSSCVNSRTGVFVLSGYAKDEDPRQKLVLDNINILDNHLIVTPMPEVDVKNEHLVLRYLDQYASGVFFIGNEYTTSFTAPDGRRIERHTGRFLIDGNIIENADFGIRSWYGNADEHKSYVHDVTISNNYFENFQFIGAMAPFKTSKVVNNIFSVNTLSPIPSWVEDDRGEDYQASAIFAAKAPYQKYNSEHGPERVQIDNNIFLGCFENTNPIVVRPKDKATVVLNNNNMVYSNTCKSPTNDIVITTNKINYGSEEATIYMGENQKSSALSPIEDINVKIDARKKNITIVSEDQQ
ncbi:MAG: hypothetical protein R3359_00130 [Marinirhabdus sp.]|nr:hypothetical protein [Marinirhabdus sp.]